MAIEVNGAEQLEAFLRDKPVEWSRVLSTRAALRVLPVALFSKMPSHHILAVLRACVMSWAAGKCSNYDMTAALSAAASGAFAVVRSSADPAAISAAASAAGSLTSYTAHSIRSAAGAAASSVFQSAGSSQFPIFDPASPVWVTIRQDVNALTFLPRPFDLLNSPLWPEVIPNRDMSVRLRSIGGTEATADGYAPWITWYQGVLDGADCFGPDLTLRIAQQPNEWWERSPSLVAADVSEWLRQRDEGQIDIPEPEPGAGLGIAEDGRIGIVPSGVPSPEEQHQLEALLEVLGEKADELAETLIGSNAFAVLLKDVSKYAEVLRQQTLSIDRLYARGNVLENTRAHLQKDIDAGNLPEMALEIAAGLDSILATHGPLIALTGRGQQLLESSHLYESRAADISTSRLAAREFANAVARSDRLFTDEVREEWPVMADAIGEGRYSERSTQLAMVGNKNVMIALAILVATPVVESAVTASIPGALAVGSLKGTIDAAWLFMVSYLPVITNLVQVSGPSLAWMKPVLRLVSRGRG